MNDYCNLQLKTWHSPCYDQFLVREWEEESFLFNPSSGDTHLLNTLSMEILSLLRQNWLNTDALIEKLPQTFGSSDSPLKHNQLIGYLQQFEAIGLIVSSQSCD